MAKDEFLGVKLSKEEAKNLRTRANDKNMTLSSYIRSLLASDPKKVKGEVLPPEYDSLFLGWLTHWQTSLVFYEVMRLERTLVDNGFLKMKPADITHMEQAEKLFNRCLAAFDQHFDQAINESILAEVNSVKELVKQPQIAT